MTYMIVHFYILLRNACSMLKLNYISRIISKIRTDRYHLIIQEHLDQ